MAGPANPRAMAPHTPGPTRTAAPQTPGSWPSHPRMRLYTLFGATGIVYLLVGFVALRVVWNLGEGPEAWAAVLEQLENPIYIAFHALALGSVVFVAVRFFRLFPKAQPAFIGPVVPPPRPILHAMLYAAWIGITVILSAILAGVIF